MLPILFLLPPQCLLCTYAIFGVVICPLKKVSSIYTLKHSNKTRKMKFLFVFVLWFFQNCSLWSKNILQWFARLRVVFVYVKYDAIPVCVEESLYFHYTFFLKSKIKIIFIYTWCIYYSLTFCVKYEPVIILKEEWSRNYSNLILVILNYTHCF